MRVGCEGEGEGMPPRHSRVLTISGRATLRSQRPERRSHSTTQPLPQPATRSWPCSWLG